MLYMQESGCKRETGMCACLYTLVYTVCFLLFVINHTRFTNLHVHPCGFSVFCLSVPGRSHTVTFGGLTLLSPVYSVHKNSFLSLCHSKSRMLCAIFVISMNLQPEEEKI